MMFTTPPQTDEASGPASWATQTAAADEPPAGERLMPLNVEGTTCPVCLGELARPIALGSRDRTRLHVHASDEARCPLSTSAWQPEGLVIRQPKGTDVAGVNRAHFVGHWPLHFQEMRRLVPSLTPQRFNVLVDMADVLNVWAHPHLVAGDLPFVLLSLAEFIAVRPRGLSAYWVRFCFDGTVRELSDLWQPGRKPPQFFRMVYDEPMVTPFPTSSQLRRCDYVVRSPGFLSAVAPELAEDEALVISRFLAQTPGIWNRVSGSDAL
jgi:hypothetical protein